MSHLKPLVENPPQAWSPPANTKIDGLGQVAVDVETELERHSKRSRISLSRRTCHALSYAHPPCAPYTEHHHAAAAYSLCATLAHPGHACPRALPCSCWSAHVILICPAVRGQRRLGRGPSLSLWFNAISQPYHIPSASPSLPPPPRPPHRHTHLKLARQEDTYTCTCMHAYLIFSYDLAAAMHPPSSLLLSPLPPSSTHYV
ncbi:hypothetical protein R3P38DRAFT_3242654 [Favolaschia claudopus]|uniref:Uncharacterized protein n=1 Tax=Favolaschia claudopus TaxID=2862362 RepID=A0AAV9Z3X7_9AGAR